MYSFVLQLFFFEHMSKTSSTSKYCIKQDTISEISRYYKQTQEKSKVVIHFPNCEFKFNGAAYILTATNVYDCAARG